MLFLFPGHKVAEIIFVRTLQLISINEVVGCYSACGDGVVIKLFLFKKDANSSERRVPSAVS